MILKYFSTIIENPDPVSEINLMVVKKGFRMERHVHTFFHVNLVLSGSVHIKTDSGTYECGAGGIFVLPPTCGHSIYSPKGYTQIGVNVERVSDLRGISRELERQCVNFTFKKLHVSEYDTSKKMEQMEKLLSVPTNANIMRAINIAEGQLLDFIEAVQNENSNEFLEQFIELTTKYNPWELKLSDISKNLCMSRTQLERKAKYTFGCGASEYCARLRYSRVCELLKSDMTLRQIADECGFCDPCHLSRFFSGRSGMSPGEYRKSIK